MTNNHRAVADRRNMNYARRQVKRGWDKLVVTAGVDLKPERVQYSDVGPTFIRVPFPKRNQTLWMFERQDTADTFHSHFYGNKLASFEEFEQS